MQERYLIVYENGEFIECADMDFSAYQKGKKVNAHFRFRADSLKAYSDIELFNAEGEFIDSCFVSSKWENVNTETPLQAPRDSHGSSPTRHRRLWRNSLEEFRRS